MENWFRDVGQAILLEALEETCDRINTSFETGMNNLLDVLGHYHC